MYNYQKKLPPSFQSLYSLFQERFLEQRCFLCICRVVSNVGIVLN